MPKLSIEQSAKYDYLESDVCFVCSDQRKLCNVYHPRILADGARGYKIHMCSPCYVSYKRLGLEQIPFASMVKLLNGRPRRSRGPNKNSEAQDFLNLGLIITFDAVSGNVFYAEDAEGTTYHADDVTKFLEIQSKLILMTNEDLEKACKTNFLDQRFINKVVSSFSS